MNTVLQRILREIKLHSRKVVVVAITGVVWAVASAKLPLILKDLVNAVEKGSKDTFEQNFIAIALGGLGFALAVAASRYLQFYTMNYIAELVTNDYRLRLQKKFMTLNLNFHTNFAQGSGGLLNRILGDIRVIQDGLRMIADLFREPLFAILLMKNLFDLNWRVTSFILIALPLTLIFLKQLSRSLRKYIFLGQDHLDQVTSTIKESLDGVRVIQSFNLEKEMHTRLKIQTNEYVEIRRKIHSRIEIMGPVTEFLTTVLMLGIIFHFSLEIFKGTSTIGALIGYVTSMIAFSQPVKKFQESYVRIQETIVAASRVYAILDETSEVPIALHPQPFPKNWQKIIYKDVSFSYGKDLVLKKINLEIKRGEYIAFVGESGSGKSTIVNLLERFYDPTSGEIFIDDVPIKQIDLQELRHHVALVTQDVFLFNDSIERNIQAGDFSKTLDGVTSVARSANAHDFIQRLPKEYQSLAGERGNLLSGGEKQRISIARAFFKDAPILILDEATSALDSGSEVEVQKGLDSLAQGRTSLVIAHRLSTIQNADRIYVMKSGEIIETGTHQELIARKTGSYLQFYQMQNRTV